MRFRHFVLHCIGLASALALSLDVALHLAQAGGLCQTQSCQAVGEYVRFGETALLLLGAAFFWILWLIFFLATRLNRPVLWHLAAVLLLAALAFDGGLLGYQFMGLGMQCWLCLGVGAALLASLLSLAWVRQAGLIACMGIAVWLGGFAANSTLMVAPQAPELEQTAFVSQPADASDQDYFLFFSLNCGHCLEVLANVARNTPQEVNWHLCSLDASPQGMAALSWIYERASQGKNAVFLTLQAKQKRKLQTAGIPEQVRSAVSQARKFFSARGYRGVPLLIAREGRGKEVILTGKRNIARFLRASEVVDKWVQP